MRIRPAESANSDWPAPRDAESTLGGSQFEFGADIFGPNKPSSHAKSTPRPHAATLPEGSAGSAGSESEACHTGESCAVLCPVAGALSCERR